MARLRLPVLFLAAAVLLSLLGLAVAERLVYRDRVLPGVRLAGVQVVGRSHAAARTRVALAAAQIERQPLLVTAGSVRFSVRPQTVGLGVDEAATTRAVQRAGRAGNPLTQLLGPLLRRLDPIEVGWVARHDRRAAARTVSAWAHKADRPAVDGDLRLRGTTVVPVPPRPGQRLDRAGTIDAVITALTLPPPRTLALSVHPLQPRIRQADVDQAVDQARRVLAGPVSVSVGRRRLTLPPAALAAALRTVQADGRLRLELDQARLRAALAGDLARLETAPRDARFRVRDGKVQVVPSARGRRLELAPVATAILGGARAVTGELRPVQPRRSTAWARSLGIRERVSAFTTMHKPGQPRVRNIHRAADLLRGQVVEPGERFSLNRAIGPRTPARGFVTAPVISRGEFSQDVGGGVSQVATTFFNAVFFGGYRIVSHQPHSYYIKRYPMGREATVSLPAPDLVFVNDSRSGILIHTSYTDAAITVTFYGDRAGRRVRAEGPRILATRPPEGTTEYVEDPKLPRGTELVEPAFTGYDVEVFRVIAEPGKPTRRERFFTRYESANPKVIRGTGGG